MQLMIVEGRWIVESSDLWLRIMVQPRRSLEGSATRVTVRAEPMPVLELLPEKIDSATPAAAWIWDGTPSSARTIVLNVLKVLRTHLEPTASHEPRARAWRSGVLARLDETAARANQVAQSQTA